MNSFVPALMLGWIGVVIALFWLLPARRAVLVSMLGGWLLLPEIAFELRGLPSYDKYFATGIVVVLAAFAFEPRRFLALRPHLLDIPMVAWCAVPLASSLSNELGLWEERPDHATDG